MSSSPDPQTPASLDVVEAQLDRAEASYQQRAQNIDGKAGLLLTAAGVIIGFANTRIAIATTIAEGLAVVAAVLAVWAFLPRIGGTIDPDALQRSYLYRPELVTRLTLLGTRINLYQADEEALRRKNRRMRWALAALLAAALTVLIGSIIKVS